MTEYFIFLSGCIGLMLSLIGLWLWLNAGGERQGGQPMLTAVPCSFLSR
jgi:hypothetical protein